MSLRSEDVNRRRVLSLIVGCGGALGLAGCGFRPVHGTGEIQGSEVSVRETLAQIYISEPRNRNEQILRNELLFAFGQNQAISPSAAQYRLDIRTNVRVVAAIQSRSGVSTAEAADASSSYTFTNIQDPTQSHIGRATARAAYDVFEQRFANIRAQRDAEERALMEIAERIKNDISAHLALG